MHITQFFTFAVTYTHISFIFTFQKNFHLKIFHKLLTKGNSEVEEININCKKEEKLRRTLKETLSQKS